MANLSSETMIEARSLSKYFGSFVAIEDISFSIPRGQIVAFLGPNGAGKSTTMRILTGFLAASKGSAQIAGFNINKDRLKIARQLGYLPENGPLYDNMTPLEMLRFLGEARGLSGKKLQSRIDQVNETCALQLVLEKQIGKLSRGYRQRVGLAQALLHDPEVLIMDEPTAGLDPNQIKDFRSNIKQLGQSKTILLSTHILQEASAVADHLMIIDRGKIIARGTIPELKKEKAGELSFSVAIQGEKDTIEAALKGLAAIKDVSFV